MGRSRTLSRPPEVGAIRVLRGFSGVLAGGIVALAAVLIVIGVLAQQRPVPGPGVLVIVGHAVAAIVAVLLQRRADQATGIAAVGWALAVVALTVVVLAAQWLV